MIAKIATCLIQSVTCHALCTEVVVSATNLAIGSPTQNTLSIWSSQVYPIVILTYCAIEDVGPASRAICMIIRAQRAIQGVVYNILSVAIVAVLACCGILFAPFAVCHRTICACLIVQPIKWDKIIALLTLCCGIWTMYTVRLIAYFALNTRGKNTQFIIIETRTTPTWIIAWTTFAVCISTSHTITLAVETMQRKACRAVS